MEPEHYWPTARVMLGAMLAAVIGGLTVGIGITWLFFANTRSQGLVALIIAFLAAGLFINVVMFTKLIAKYFVPSRTLMAAQSILWILLALLFTKATCDELGITWSNVGHILSSWEAQFDRAFVQSIILGWVLIAAAGIAGAFVSRKILEYQ